LFAHDALEHGPGLGVPTQIEQCLGDVQGDLRIARRDDQRLLKRREPLALAPLPETQP